MTDPGGAGLDVDALAKALTAAKLQLDQAVAHIQGDPAAAKLARLEDQNTGCQNSGCGGALAPEAVRNVGRTAQPG
jgi:hypothetical protein